MTTRAWIFLSVVVLVAIAAMWALLLSSSTNTTDPTTSSHARTDSPTRTLQTRQTNHTANSQRNTSGERTDGSVPEDLGADATKSEHDAVGYQRLLSARDDRAWKSELKTIARKEGPKGVVAALKAWRASRGADAPQSETLLIHQAVAEFFAEDRTEALAHLTRVLLTTRVSNDIAVVHGCPALLCLAGGTRSELMPETAKTRLLAESRANSQEVIGETVFGFWSGSGAMGSESGWRDFVRWLSDKSKDMAWPGDALASCIWVHAIYMNEPRFFAGLLPPASGEFLERYGGGLGESGPNVAGLFEVLPKALQVEDPEGLLLQQECRRWEALDSRWTKEKPLGTWSFRAELARRFDGFRFSDGTSQDLRREFELLLELAHDLVK